jgi:hypothetical protein
MGMLKGNLKTGQKNVMFSNGSGIWTFNVEQLEGGWANNIDTP